MSSEQRVWKVEVTSPEGAYDFGTVTLLGTTMTPKQLADRLAEIAWRITADLANPSTESEADE